MTYSIRTDFNSNKRTELSTNGKIEEDRATTATEMEQLHGRWRRRENYKINIKNY